MQTTEAHFFSDGHKLAATFFSPDDLPPAPQPLIVACSGFTGLRTIHPARFARFLTARGHACFAFDYRGCADSEGPPGRVLLEEQVRDIVHAVAFAASHPSVDGDRTFLLGWGMGAGLVLDAARGLTGVAGIIAVNGFYCGERVQRAHRSDDGFRAFRAQVDAERAGRARTGKAAWVDPFDIYPLDPQSREYVDAVLRKMAGYHADRYSMELADSLLRWNPAAYAPQMHVPLLVAHGTHNRLHPPQEAESLYTAYAGPKAMYWIDGAGHTEFMHDEDPKFQALGAAIAEWIKEQLAT